MKPMRPFFRFYGGKWRATRSGLYPAPASAHIIEPFAGGAGYSVNYADRNVYLHDADPRIAGLWQYLIRVKESEIRGLPIDVNHVDECLGCCQEAKWLIGFWFNPASSGPRNTRTKWGVDTWTDRTRQRIADQVGRIRHWKAFHSTYDLAAPIRATWFIDPPYQAAHGRHYKYSTVDYPALGDWVRERRGQVIVCESGGGRLATL